MKRHLFSSKAKIHIYTDTSTSSEDQGSAMGQQEHARVRRLAAEGSILSPTNSTTSTSVSNTSLSSSISRFRTDFEELKCKMRIFGESLSLCRCIADDFRNKLTQMERRLENLERRHRLRRSESNYSAIIQKNKRLSHKTQQDAKEKAHVKMYK
ncbi:uncharacterized protein LOC131842310 [Achroia grisella]|uniref:uncharacterized protein LOC131842310 n=1 Tax=Achroia grisella TaxID=688607 RepID=UPI0027D23EC6|nr:uncharacterized protein LOC131842310 [Achroia grisella]